MIAALYQNCPTPNNLPSHAHGGLWFDKFCTQWAIRENTAEIGTRKLDWIKTVTGRPVGELEELIGYSERVQSLVENYHGQSKIFRSESRFTTGLGSTHPVENGFSWHHILGTPYLPGSSLKGLVRDWVEQWLDSENSEKRKEVINRIFGEPGHVGSVIFLDACPVAPITLEADIMTPHYTPYYSNEKPPGDWYNPTPIPFLTMAARNKFLFAVIPKPGKKTGCEEDVVLAMGWIEDALTWLGAGAKTAVGYGRFAPDSAGEQVWLRKVSEDRHKVREKADKEALAKEVATWSVVRCEMEKDGYGIGGEAFMQALTQKWLKQMETTDHTLEERQEIAMMLGEWYVKNKADQWKKPTGKNIDKVERIKLVWLR